MSEHFDGTAPDGHATTAWSGEQPQTLAEYLLARYTEAEAGWRAVSERDEVLTFLGDPIAPLMLADLAAKRAIVALHDTAHQCPDGSGPRSEDYSAGGDDRFPPCLTTLALAREFADRPDFDERWRA